MQLHFHPIQESDLPVIKTIYDWYILHSTATFYTEPIPIDQLKASIYLDHPWYKSFMIRDHQAVLGYCYLTSYNKRQAYNRTAEITIYLHHDHCHKGIGKAAIAFLELQAQAVGLKNLVAGISGDNAGSIALFEKSGYTKCAHFKNIGYKFDTLLDVVFYQKELG